MCDGDQGSGIDPPVGSADHGHGQSRWLASTMRRNLLGRFMICLIGLGSLPAGSGVALVHKTR